MVRNDYCNVPTIQCGRRQTSDAYADIKENIANSFTLSHRFHPPLARPPPRRPAPTSEVRRPGVSLLGGVDVARMIMTGIWPFGPVKDSRRELPEAACFTGHDDGELVVNPPTPCRIGKRPPAPKNPAGQQAGQFLY